MNQTIKLARNAFLFAVGTIGSKAISFFMLPLYTRFLTANDFGQLDVLQTTVYLLLPLVSFQAVEAVFRFALESKEKQSLAGVLSSGIFLSFIGLAITVMFIPLFLRTQPFSDYLLLFYVILFLALMEGVLKQFIRGIEKIKAFVASDIFYTAIFVLCNVCFLVYFKLGLKGYLLSIVIGYLTSILILIVSGKAFAYISFRFFNLKLLKIMLTYSLPLIPNSLMWWVMNSSNRYLLTYFLGFEATGLYAVACKFPLLLLVFQGIFFQAWQISAVEEFGAEDYARLSSNIFSLLATFLLLLTSLLLVFLKFIMMILVAGPFYIAWAYVPLLLLATLFSAFASFWGVNYIASKETGGAFSTSIAGAAVNLGLNLLCIPLWGIQAASFSAMVSFFVMWVLRLYHTKKFVQLEFEQKMLLRSFLLLGIQILGLFFVENTVLSTIYQLLLLTFLVLVHRENISRIIGFARQLNPGFFSTFR